MDGPAQNRSLHDHHAEIIQLFLFEDWSYHQIQQRLLQYQGFQWQPSIDQLKRITKAYGVHRKLCGNEVLSIRNAIGPALTTWSCLVLANGVLLNNVDIEQHYQRNLKNGPRRRSIRQTRRTIVRLVPLFFEFKALQEPGIFKKFRQLLYYARIHFESSFERGIWAPDHRGLYGRAEMLKKDLSALSDMHNMVSDALLQYKDGKYGYGQASMRRSFSLHKTIVESKHHRQFSDIIATLLLIRRNGLTAVQLWIIGHLVSVAKAHLLANDPRRIMFETLEDLPLDSAGHLYLAFDAFCRHVWNWKIGSGPNDAKACYSYNQASFPRADAGEFYEFFQQTPSDRILHILKDIDIELGEYSHETFMVWHTAIRYLFKEQRYREAEAIIRRLCMRVYDLGTGFDYNQAPQLNYDSMLSFYLLGSALQAQGSFHAAKTAFELCVELRNQIIPNHVWCAGKAAALRQLEAITTSGQEGSEASTYIQLKEKMYASIDIQDMDGESS